MNILLSLFLILTSYQGVDDSFRKIQLIIESGNTRELINFCDTNVEINMDGQRNNYSKAQAETIFRNFFNKYPPDSFLYIHQGSSADELKYTIGQYNYSGGKYRIVMLIKKIGNKFLIDTINFSKD